MNIIVTSLLKKQDTITEFVMVLLVIIGLVLVLMEIVIVPVGLYRSPSIGGLLKPINPNGTHYRKLFFNG